MRTKRWSNRSVFWHLQVRGEHSTRRAVKSSRKGLVRFHRLFEKLMPEQLTRLEQRARVRRFPKNTPVYLPSDAADSVLLLAECLGSAPPQIPDAAIAPQTGPAIEPLPLRYKH